MHSRSIALFFAAVFCARMFCAEPDIVTIDEGKVYRKVNGEPISGKDVMDLIVEESWDKELQVFVEQELRNEEVRSKLEKLIQQKGVVRDPKQLGAGEAVRIGARGYSRGAVREFIAEASRRIELSELKGYLEKLQFDKLVKRALSDLKIELNEKD